MFAVARPLHCRSDLPRELPTNFLGNVLGRETDVNRNDDHRLSAPGMDDVPRTFEEKLVCPKLKPLHSEAGLLHCRDAVFRSDPHVQYSDQKHWPLLLCLRQIRLWRDCEKFNILKKGRQLLF